MTYETDQVMFTNSNGLRFIDKRTGEKEEIPQEAVLFISDPQTQGGDIVDKETRALIEATSLLLDRLDEHGNIDHVREEGPIQDLRHALENIKTK